MSDITPSACTKMAEALRRVDVAAEDLEVVMDAAAMLQEAGRELHSVIRNRDRLMKNRNNKQGELRTLKQQTSEIRAYAEATNLAPVLTILDSYEQA